MLSHASKLTERQNQSDPDHSHGFYIAQVSRVAFKMLTLHEKNVCVFCSSFISEDRKPMTDNFKANSLKM